MINLFPIVKIKHVLINHNNIYKIIKKMKTNNKKKCVFITFQFLSYLLVLKF